jgi:hypothetical protein
MCPCCGGEGVYMGALACLIWLRCRDCGAEFNLNRDEFESEEG